MTEAGQEDTNPTAFLGPMIKQGKGKY
jgi:hypothetical protein